MPNPGRWAVLVSLGAYNLVQNLVIPARAYVPLNLGATVGLVTLARRQGCTWDDLGLEPANIRRGLRVGVVGVAVSAAVAAVTLNHRSLAPYLLDQRAAGQRSGDVLFRVLVRLPLGTALFEEVAFRGAIEGIWQRSGASKREAALAAAVAFGLWHLIPGTHALNGNPLDLRMNTVRSRAAVVTLGAVVTGIASLGLSRLRNRSCSLVAPWLTHAAINSAMYLTGVAAWRRTRRR
jgi:membrane protease YdiL (CAAX protease family)